VFVVFVVSWACIGCACIILYFFYISCDKVNREIVVSAGVRNGCNN